tara:strand:- start:154 stop:489 length:336 start_codon:yes stop_codon:yes gene_type:complete
MNVMLLDDVGKNNTENLEKNENSNENNEKNNKNSNKNQEKNEENIEECLVCFELIGDKKYVTCKLCDRKCHKKCYYKFVQKNPFFNRKCFQCQTKTIKFKRKKRYNLCCFC